MLPDVRGLKGPLSCLNEARFGIVWGSMGAARSSLEAARRLRDDARAVRQAHRRLPAHPAQARRHGARAGQGRSCSRCTSAAARTPGRLRPEQVSFGKLNNVREALEICRTARTILGANGISLEYPVIRHMNNLESVLTYEGTVEMHTLCSARPSPASPRSADVV